MAETVYHHSEFYKRAGDDEVDRSFVDHSAAEAKFLFFTFSWNNVQSTALPNTDEQEIQEIETNITLIEGLLLSLFALVVICFLVTQISVYVKFFTSKRNSWKLRRRNCRMHTLAYNCPKHERRKQHRGADRFSVTAMPCKPGLAYSARSIRGGDLVYIAPVEQNAGWEHGGSFRMAPSNYASVFMVDPRGHYGPRLEASPEATLQMYRTTKAQRRSHATRAAAMEKKCCCHRRNFSLPLSVSPDEGKGCENPGYDSDTVSSSVKSPELVSTTASFQKLTLPSTSSPTGSERDGDCSDSPIFSESDQDSACSPKRFSTASTTLLPTRCLPSASDEDNDCERKRIKRFLFRKHGSSNESGFNQSCNTKARKYMQRSNRPVTSCSSSDSDRNSPDSSTQCLKARTGGSHSHTSGSESDYSLTSVSSLSVLSALPLPSLLTKNSKCATIIERSTSFKSLRNSWLAKV